MVAAVRVVRTRTRARPHLDRRASDLLRDYPRGELRVNRRSSALVSRMAEIQQYQLAELELAELEYQPEQLEPP